MVWFRDVCARVCVCVRAHALAKVNLFIMFQIQLSTYSEKQTDWSSAVQYGSYKPHLAIQIQIK